MGDTVAREGARRRVHLVARAARGFAAPSTSHREDEPGNGAPVFVAGPHRAGPGALSSLPSGVPLPHAAPGRCWPDFPRMRLFAISDLHLSLGVDKPMDIFGENWVGHEAKMRTAWDELVGPDD